VNLAKIASEPIFFERNRVRRVYTGGKLFGDFFGETEEAADSFFPEEWVASAVEALNGEFGVPNEGLSKIKGENLFLRGLLEAEKTRVLGGRADFGALVKILDSAVRLPMQAHPDKAFSRAHFNSGYGKGGLAGVGDAGKREAVLRL
jgi:mannose-6-phosphate isomerase